MLSLFSFVVPSQSAYAAYSFTATPVSVNVSDNTQLIPQLATSGNNVYVVWKDTSSSDTVRFAKSTTGGTFNPAIDLSLAGTVDNPRIVASGSNVFVVWQDSTTGPTKILYEESTDSGSTFNSGSPVGPPTTLSSNFAPSFKPQIAVSGSNVYVVWQQTVGVKPDVFFTKSIGGGSFDPPVNLSDNIGNSINPRIIASGTNVYVVWQDDSSGNNEILYEKSTDSGSTFNLGTSNTPGAPLNLSNTPNASITPQITISDSNVYVVWDEFVPSVNFDQAFFTRSIDGGDTFGSSINLDINSPAGSGTNTPISPQIVASGNNVYVVWQDFKTDLQSEIFYERSTDNGSTFNSGTSGNPGAPTDLSADSDTSISPQIAASGSNVYVVWFDDVTPNILVKTSNDGGSSFPDFHTIDTNPGSSAIGDEQIFLNGLNPDVVWEDDSNAGTLNIFFSSGTPSSIIISFDASQYKIGSTATITISDPSGGTSISSVNIKSNSDTTGITTIFSQSSTNVYTGTVTFTSGSTSGSLLHVSAGDTITVSYSTGTGNAKIFPRIVSFNLAEYFTNSNVVITVSDQNSNTNTGLAETIPVTITATSGFSSTFNFQETGLDTGIFVLPSGGSLPLHVGDTITASYSGASATAIVIAGVSPGGGGGGLIRPGLVLDVIAAAIGGGPSVPPTLDLGQFASSVGILPDKIKDIILNHDPFKPLEPQSDIDSFDYPLVIDNSGYPLSGYTSTIVTKTERVGVPVNLILNIPSTNELVHIGLYTNVQGSSDDIYSSDTSIVYDKGAQLQIVDPHKYFGDVKLNMTKNGIKNKVNLQITFAKPMKKSDLDLRVWDDRRSSADMRILDAWQVEESANKTLVQVNATVSKGMNPVQNNTSDLMPYIREWSGYEPKSVSDTELLDKMGIKATHIPTWFMKTTKWLINGDTNQDEFVAAIKYMYENGIIK